MTYQAHPLRIQLRRTKGWKKPEGAVVCSRPSKWGNPFLVNMPHPVHGWPMSRGEAAQCFRQLLTLPPYTLSCMWPKRFSDLLTIRGWILAHVHELRGLPLGCWCALDCECHVDTLCELANAPEPGREP